MFCVLTYFYVEIIVWTVGILLGCYFLNCLSEHKKQNNKKQPMGNVEEMSTSAKNLFCNGDKLSLLSNFPTKHITFVVYSVKAARYREE